MDSDRQGVWLLGDVGPSALSVPLYREGSWSSQVLASSRRAFPAGQFPSQ